MVMGAAKPAHSERRGIIVMMSNGSAAAADLAGLRNYPALISCGRHKVAGAPTGWTEGRIAGAAIERFLLPEAAAEAVLRPDGRRLEFSPADLADIDAHGTLRTEGTINPVFLPVK